MKENKKEYGMPKTNSDFKTGNRKKEKDKSKKRQATERKENEVEIEKRWKKNKARDIPRILSATYCSKRTKAAKNSGNGASHSET